MRFFLATILFVFSLCFSFGQEQNNFLLNPNFKNYSSKDGLSQRSVISIIQDHQGYLWFGTRYGLNKFDGKTFETYHYSALSLNTISNNWILSLLEDRNKNIWVGTRNGLNKYIRGKNSFERVFLDKEKNIPYNIEVSDIKQGAGHFLWIATTEGLHRFNTQTYKVLKFKTNVNNPSSIGSNATSSVLLTKRAELWVCNSKSIDIYQPKTNSFIHFSYPDNDSPQLTKNTTTTLFEDANNVVWLGYDGGLAYFDSKENRFKNFKFPSNSEKAIPSAVRSIFQDQYKNLWIGSYNGLYYLNLKANKITKYNHDKKNSNSLSQNSIYKIIEDRRGDLWIGTWAGGINYLDNKSNTFTSFSEGGFQLSLNNNVVSSIIEPQENILWIGTEGGGINSYNRLTGAFSYILNNPNNPNSLSGNNIKAIIKDAKGSFWVATHAAGLNKVDIQGSNMNIKRFLSVPSDPKTISDNKITCLENDQFGDIWIGTSGGGLNVLNTKTESFYRINQKDTLIGNFIYKIAKCLSPNSFWVGGDNGLFKIDVITKKITPIKFQKILQKNYTLKTVISIYQQTPNILWIGTEGDGLYRYDLLTKKSERFGIQKGLSDEVIYTIVPDAKNNIWLSTNNGLSRLNLNNFQIKKFNESDGLQGKEFNYGAAYITKKGEMVFGGTNGFSIFNPSKITEDQFVPPTIIHSLMIRNKPLVNLSDSIKAIDLKYNQNDINFNFIALEYSKSNKIQYSYQLEGFDDHWNTIGNKTSATYTNLDPGNYVFKVKATNSDGIWNQIPTTLTITINPPVWRTWWAYLLYLIILSVLIYFVRKIVLVRIMERNALVQAEIDKTKIEELNKLKLQLFTNISHDFRTPLTLIIGPLKRLIDTTKEDSHIQNQLKGINRNATILLQLINQLLDFRKAESGKLKMQYSKSNFVPFIENIKLLFVELANEREIKYDFSFSSPSIELWFDQIEIKKAVLNIVSNAFKFTPRGGSISIHLTENIPLNRIELEIIDTGKGIDKKDIPFIFDQYFQLGKNNELKSGTGVGLTVAKEIIDMHAGTIEVISEKNKGTSFTIYLPLGKEHIKEEDIVLEHNVSINEEQFEYYNQALSTALWKKEAVENDVLEHSSQLPTLLIVDDNVEVRTLIKSIFYKKMNVIEAKNGLKGLNKAKNNVVDIIISDVMMPKMDGIEFCNAIKSDIVSSHIPVILLTARTSSKVQKTGFQTGADAYISKPFDPELLELQVENLIKSRQKLIEKFKKDFILEPKELDLVSTDEVFLKKAMDIVEENIADPEFMAISFSEKMFMSQSVLYRKLKAITGQTISEFIRAVKLKKAGQLLIKTDNPIGDIAIQVGFNDLKYFRKCFKNTFGETPSDYRKLKQLSDDTQNE